MDESGADTIRSFATPMMQQYAAIKKGYKDCLLFFRLGDFYELFLEDAEIGSDVLDITLTKRDKGRDGSIPMCGVPYHAVDGYIARLVKSGYKVAICEQVSSPGEETKIVEREVVRVVTPSTLLDENALDRKQNNYLMVLLVGKVKMGKRSAVAAFADVGTGDLHFTTFIVDEQLNGLEDVITKFQPSECILREEDYGDVLLRRKLQSLNANNVFPLFEWDEFALEPENYLCETFGVSSIESLGLKEVPSEVLRVVAVTVRYLQITQKTSLSHLRFPKLFDISNYVGLDAHSIENLELFRTSRDKEFEGSLLWLLDRTRTAMGGRLLRSWIARPLMDIQVLDVRHDTVSFFIEEYSLVKEVREAMREVLDVERITSRLTIGSGNARDLVGLRSSLEQIKSISELLSGRLPQGDALVSLYSQEVEGVVSLLADAIVDEPPISMKGGGMIREGYSPDLDTYRSLKGRGESFLNTLLIEEKQKTGISTLKVGFNKVFGYYLEVSKAQAAKVPDRYIRKQTLVNAERYIVQELKEFEEKILHADDAIVRLEEEIVQSIIAKVVRENKRVYQLSQVVAELDVLAAFAEISSEHHYVRPIFDDTSGIECKDARHPIVEVLLSEGSFVPNDISLDHGKKQVALLTGPNMAGKSTYIRQVALNVLLAQIGCFVACKEARIGLVDQIFTRIGAGDDLATGLSTFMVEMVEVANILGHATSRSLVILDEVGRGTSTYDGVSIAWAVVEHLVSGEVRPLTLFATHYHELLDMANMFAGVINLQVVVERDEASLRFLHKVMPGGTDKSYGIDVAKRAGLPSAVIDNAYAMLEKLEDRRGEMVLRPDRKKRGQGDISDTQMKLI